MSESQQPQTSLAEVEERINMLNRAWRFFMLFEKKGNHLGIKLADRRIMLQAIWLEQHGISDLLDLECDEKMHFSLPEHLRQKLKELEEKS